MTNVDPEPSMVQAESALALEHQRLQQLVRQVAGAHHLGELLQRLKEFRSALEPHFVLEEAPGGFFEVVESRSGRHLAAIARLRLEHGIILREVDQLAERARGVVMGPVAEVLRQAADLARRLEQHESRENEILGEALYDDTGHSD